MDTLLEDFEFLQYVMMEAFRMNPPQTETSWLTMTEDTKIGSVVFKKGDIFNVNFTATGYDKTQWQRPNEFIPERFDLKNPMSLKPDGTKRSPGAWTPFAGGHRVCFGRKMAIASTLTICSYMTQAFDFKFVNPKFEEQLPVSGNAMSQRNKIEVILTERQD